MSDVLQFNNHEFGELTVIEKDGEFLFLGKEVAEKLGYSNTRDTLARHVAKDDRADVGIHDGRQMRNMTAINESGLYSLIPSSKLSSAKKFKHWITKEVLPSIRKHGGYIAKHKNYKFLEDYDKRNVFDIDKYMKRKGKPRLKANVRVIQL